jgi:outer membrane protein assembly factor BamA
VYYYQDGQRSDPRFAYTPYLHRLYVQGFATTGGQQYHTIDYDAPYIANTSLRVRAAGVFERNTNTPYFGRGAVTLAPLSYPGSSDISSKLSAFEESAAQLQPDGSTYARYDRYLLTRPLLRGSVEHDLFGGVVRVLAGASISHASVHDYSGELVDADGPMGNQVQALEAPTKLRDDCASGRSIGCAGGWNNFLKLGLAYDTRDYEPDPTSGLFAELTGEASSKVFGSGWDYGRATASVRGFLPIAEEPVRMVAAARAAYSVQTGDVPFFEMNTLAFTDNDISGLGGLRTMRGFAQDRFAGKVAALANFELLFRLVETKAWKSSFAFMLAPFIDLGRVFDRFGDTSLKRWSHGQGAALRIICNQATVVSVDYGISQEGYGLYINFGHQF